MGAYSRCRARGGLCNTVVMGHVFPALAQGSGGDRAAMPRTASPRAEDRFGVKTKEGSLNFNPVPPTESPLCAGGALQITAPSVTGTRATAMGNGQKYMSPADLTSDYIKRFGRLHLLHHNIRRRGQRRTDAGTWRRISLKTGGIS